MDAFAAFATRHVRAQEPEPEPEPMCAEDVSFTTASQQQLRDFFRANPDVARRVPNTPNGWPSFSGDTVARVTMPATSPRHVAPKPRPIAPRPRPLIPMPRAPPPTRRTSETVDALVEDDSPNPTASSSTSLPDPSHVRRSRPVATSWRTPSWSNHRQWSQASRSRSRDDNHHWSNME